MIEDCAHAHGAAWRGRGAGSIGTAGSFSMQTGKLMTAGEGGAILTSEDDVFDACQAYANCGRLSETDRSGRSRCRVQLQDDRLPGGHSAGAARATGVADGAPAVTRAAGYATVSRRSLASYRLPVTLA